MMGFTAGLEASWAARKTGTVASSSKQTKRIRFFMIMPP
jgi:hypothetical protein